MKNLKLSWELSSTLQLQSQNELIRSTAFDIEQNRFFFASSNNILYSLHLSSSQNEELRGSSAVIDTVDLDAGDFITSMEYVMEKESLIIGTSSGDLLLYNVDDSAMEVVGRVEGGVKSISPSPDGDLLCIITGVGQMLVMTHDWDLLYETPVEDHVEDADTHLLAAIVRTKAYDSIKIWFFSNNRWYLKQEIRETAFWSKNSKNSLAASLTDGSLSVVELPELDTWQDLEGEVIHVELCITEDLTSFMHLTWLDSRVLLGVILEPPSNHNEFPKYYIQELEVVCSEDHIPGSVTGSGFDANVVNKLPIESTVTGLVSNPVKKRSAFLQFNGGNIFEYQTNSPLHEHKNLHFSSSCPWMSVGPIEDYGLPDFDPFLMFGLDNNGKLHVNQTVLCNNCSSFSLYSNSTNQTITHLILATKQDLLFVVEIRDIVLGLTEVKYGNFVPVVITRKNAEEGKKFIQIWEKGSKILGVVHGDESAVIIQTIRGNLESIYPRKLVLESIVNALVQGRFRDSLLMVRRHRIDFNVIVDHRGWQDFLKLATEFVKQVENLTYITDFVCSLKNENVMETLYKAYISYTNEEKGTDMKDSMLLDGQNKVNSVLLAVRKALEEQIVESAARELCILTTLARSDPPYLEEALERVKVIREMELSDCNDAERKRVPSSEESLKHLLWLSESEAVFEAALGLYDLNLAAIVALNSQQDPKEFLPFLQELEILPIHIMRYKIDLKLRRFEKALQHIVAAGDTYFEDCIDLIKNNPQLFPQALQLITDPNKKKQVLEAWGDQLSNIKCFEDAATTYLCCNNLEKALKSYRSSNNWGGVLTVAGLMKLPKEEIMQMAYELCEELQTIGKPSEAAKIAFDYCNDIKNGISLLINAREWEEALRIGLMHGIEDLISDVKIGAVECGNSLIAEYEEGLEKIGKYLARYLAVRQRRLLLAAKLRADERSINELDDDAVSEASSSFSGMSAYTTGTRKGSAASMSSSATSKRGIRRQKKKGKIRAGSPDEEMALVDHMKGMSLTDGAKRELKSLLGCLVMIGKEDIAQKLQRVGENFQLSQISAVKLAEDAMACDLVDEHTFVLEVYMKKLRKELLQSDEFSWQSKVFVAP
ncbi:hypothetical protein M8C21_012143 [Ambrosia artemisiifolia]|uniref:Elongator complex protein 1 n=1 Tax=Ambrosia artemisiifolia TaxID=4212 RepID=A0AAD5GNZ4_AMBAR|nr:hypothetical protein M8C21_012143 [Ambrosia artemisiifolia]